MNIQKYSDSIVIDDQFQMFSDGVFYNLLNNDDIPQWLFELKDFILKNHKIMLEK
jgi:hypothetical protein